MNPIYVTLQVGESTNIGGDVKKVKVRQAIGPIVLRTPSEECPADLGETITFESASNRVQVINAHDAPNTLELIVIASDEGDVAAASSSVAVTNLDQLKQNPNPLIARPPGDMYTLYETLVPEGGNIIISPNETVLVMRNYFVAWIESLDLEVVSGEISVQVIEYNPSRVPFSDYEADNVNGRINPLLLVGTSIDNIPRYYAGERLHWNYQDRIDLVYAHNTGTVDAEIRYYGRLWQMAP